MSQNINDLGTFKKVITCPNLKCGAKLRVPVGEGKLHVTCPKCGLEFMHDSGGEKEKTEMFSSFGLDKMLGMEADKKADTGFDPEVFKALGLDKIFGNDKK